MDTKRWEPRRCPGDITRTSGVQGSTARSLRVGNVAEQRSGKAVEPNCSYLTLQHAGSNHSRSEIVGRGFDRHREVFNWRKCAVAASERGSEGALCCVDPRLLAAVDRICELREGLGI
jgi:hypothetical protein